MPVKIIVLGIIEEKCFLSKTKMNKKNHELFSFVLY